MPKLLNTSAYWNLFPGKHQDLLAQSGWDIVHVPKDIASEAELEALLQEHQPDAAIASDEKWGEPAFAATSTLKVISRHGTGVANVDQAAAKKHGIGVANTPGTTRTPVSEVSVFLIGEALRHICASNQVLHEGKWTRVPGLELLGMKVLLVGAGNIPQETAFRLAAFGADVTMASRNMNDKLAAFLNECEAVRGASSRIGPVRWLQCAARNLVPHLKQFDVIVAQCPAGPETDGFIDGAFLSGCKAGAILGNMSRGALIANDDDIIHALDCNQIGHFFTDVFRVEPVKSKSDTPFLGHPKATVASHEGWLTVQNIGRQLGGAFENCWNALRGLPLPEGRVWVVEPGTK